jgi:protein-tyrosine phosphatase
VTLSGLCDLHCHYIPAVDDGVRTPEAGIELLRGLKKLGYERVVATPHIRTGMFDNRKLGLLDSYSKFISLTSSLSDIPSTDLAAEHYCDDVFFELFERGEALPYPGGHAALVEFPSDRLPLNLGEKFFRMNVRGVRPVIAHPERYTPVFRDSEPIADLVDRGALALLDTMALVGKYGRKPQQAAERMLEEGLYYAACSDTHKPEDLPTLAQAIERLIELQGAQEAQALLGEHPKHILAGTVPD